MYQVVALVIVTWLAPKFICFWNEEEEHCGVEWNGILNVYLQRKCYLWAEFKPGIQSDCAVPCVLNHDPEKEESSDVILIECNTHVFPYSLHQGQLSALWCMESRKDTEITDLAYDIRLTHEGINEDNHIQVTYLRKRNLFVNETARRNTMFKKRKELGIAYIASNCMKRRIEYIQELSKYIKVYAFGNCLHNSNASEMFPECNGIYDRLEQARCIYKHFMFVLAFENSIEKDYVSEKLVDLWDLGVVPIYWGAPNAQEFAPSSHSFIDVSKYQNPKDLADKLLYLTENMDEYYDYFSWIGKPLPEHYLKLSTNSFENGICSLCKQAIKILGRKA